jgi:signal transduction histidine kinase
MGTAPLVGALRRSLNVVARPHVRDRIGFGRLAEEQAALRRVATLVAEGAPPPAVFEAVSGEVGRLIGAHAALILRYGDDGAASALGGWRRTLHYTGGRVWPQVSTRFVPERGTVARLVFETGRPGRVDSYEGVAGAVAATIRADGWRSAAGAPIFVEGRLWGAVIVASSDRAFPGSTEGRLTEFTELAATAIANAESREELTRLAEEQAALRRVATLVAEGAPPQSLFAVVAEEIARVVHVPFVRIVSYELDGSATERASFSEGGELFPVGTRWSLDGTNVVALVRERGRAARINDYAGLEGAIAQAVRGAGIRSTVGVPIAVQGRIWGTMVVSTPEPEPLPESTEARVADFTELVATAIANAESRAELDASRARIVATADATRRQIERDLHDGAQQQLVSLILDLRAAQAAVPAELHERRAELSRTLEGLTTVLDELHEIARGIHPAILSEGGLAPALKTLARRSAVPVELDMGAELRLSERVEVGAYYVVSEALTNAAKHAGASVVQVAVEVRGRKLCVSVRDDGRGGADPSRGSGLFGLKDRAEAIGGTMSLQSRPGAGTSLHVEFPLDEPSY